MLRSVQPGRSGARLSEAERGADVGSAEPPSGARLDPKSEATESYQSPTPRYPS